MTFERNDNPKERKKEWTSERKKNNPNERNLKKNRWTVERKKKNTFERNVMH